MRKSELPPVFLDELIIKKLDLKSRQGYDVIMHTATLEEAMDIHELKMLIEAHLKYTGSPCAEEILSSFPSSGYSITVAPRGCAHM